MIMSKILKKDKEKREKYEPEMIAHIRSITGKYYDLEREVKGGRKRKKYVWI